MEPLKQCISCVEFKPQSAFNIEHVFPETIGGTFTTKVVCIKCNSELNKNVDEAFVKSSFVVHYRHVFNLKKHSKRNIPNLTNHPVKDADGNDRIIKYVDGQIKGELIDKFSYKIHDDGRIECRLEIDGTKADKKDEIIKEHLEKLSKELKIDLGPGYELGKMEVNQTKPFSFTLDAPNNCLIKQCIKIAYEVACLSQSQYLMDETAKKLIRFLRFNETTESFKEEINQIGINRANRYEDWFKLLNLPLHQHAVLIENIAGDGVYAAVKIFNYVYPVKLTNNTELFTKPAFLFINDIITREQSSNHMLNYHLLHLELRLETLPQNEAEQIKTKGLPYFISENDPLIFYKTNGEVRYPDLNTLCGHVIKDPAILKTVNGDDYTFDVKQKSIGLKTITGVFAPVSSITVKQQMVIHHLPEPTIIA